MSPSPPTSRPAPLPWHELGSSIGRWVVRNPVPVALLLTIAATIYYFYAVVPLYAGLPIWAWAWGRFAPEYNFEHGKLVPLIFLGLIWLHSRSLRDAPRSRSWWGIPVILLGLAIFCAGSRTMQGRVGMFSFPVILLGAILFVCGPKTARIMLFPCAFLVFMIPVVAIEQATFRLQFLITGSASAVCNLIGIQIHSVGTTLRAADESFGFEIAEGCSGIRSLMALTMLAAVYAHLTQDKLWKKLLIFGSSAIFAIIGNAGRIVTIVLVAKFIDPKLAGGIYHEYSGFIFFPIALGAMVLFSRLINFRSRDPGRLIVSRANKKEEKVTYDH
jgi:exosortase